MMQFASIFTKKTRTLRIRSVNVQYVNVQHSKQYL